MLANSPQPMDQQGVSGLQPSQGPSGRRLHIAHRRSPSELTPLMSTRKGYRPLSFQCTTDMVDSSGTAGPPATDRGFAAPTTANRRHPPTVRQHGDDTASAAITWKCGVLEWSITKHVASAWCFSVSPTIPATANWSADESTTSARLQPPPKSISAAINGDGSSSCSFFRNIWFHLQ